MLIVELFEDTCSPEERMVTFTDLRNLEDYLDQFFKRLHIDVNLTGRHFIDRVNDERNGRQISICELREIFKKFYVEHARTLLRQKPGFEAVLRDLNSNINMPFMLKYDHRNREIDLIAKTVMRKKNFHAKDEKTLEVNTK